jgi:hypothetical protein
LLPNQINESRVISFQFSIFDAGKRSATATRELRAARSLSFIPAASFLRMPLSRPRSSAQTLVLGYEGEQRVDLALKAGLRHDRVLGPLREIGGELVLKSGCQFAHETARNCSESA